MFCDKFLFLLCALGTPWANHSAAFPKKCGNARMPPSGKNIVYIIQIQQLVKYSLSDWVVMMKMVMRMVVSDHQKSFFVRTYECHSYQDPRRKNNLLVCYIFKLLTT